MQYLNSLKSSTRSKKWPMRALETFLLIVSGWRTWDFTVLVMAGLPGVVGYAVLSVIISEGAYLVWSKFAYPNADDGPQETVSILMIAFNTLGLLLLSFGENLVRATSHFSWSATAAGILAFTPWAMLAMNLVGALLFGVLDDDHIDAKTIKAQNRLDKNAERDLKHAETMGHITAKLTAIEMLNGQAQELANELAPYYFKDIRDRITGQTAANLKRKVTKLDKESALIQKTPQVDNSPDYFPVPISGGNGHSPKVKS